MLFWILKSQYEYFENRLNLKKLLKSFIRIYKKIEIM